MRDSQQLSWHSSRTDKEVCKVPWAKVQDCTRGRQAPSTTVYHLCLKLMLENYIPGQCGCMRWEEGTSRGKVAMDNAREGRKLIISWSFMSFSDHQFSYI